MTRAQLKTAILNVNPSIFDELALQVFLYQYENNAVYRQFVDLLKVNPSSVNDVEKIPFLPISFFKNFTIKSGNWQEEAVFSSSGTTGQVNSQHFIKEVDFYNDITKFGFEQFFVAWECRCH